MRPRWMCVGLLVVSCGGGGEGEGDGGGGGTDGGPLTGDDLDRACGEFCSHAIECGWTAEDAGCEASCASDAVLFNGDLWSDWLACDASAPCAEPAGKSCFIEALAAAEPRPIHEEYVDRCEAAREACGIASEATLPDCGVDEVLPFTDAYVSTEVLPCFEQSCDAMISCVEETVRDAF